MGAGRLSCQAGSLRLGPCTMSTCGCGSCVLKNLSCDLASLCFRVLSLRLSVPLVFLSLYSGNLIAVYLSVSVSFFVFTFFRFIFTPVSFYLYLFWVSLRVLTNHSAFPSWVNRFTTIVENELSEPFMLYFCISDFQNLIRTMLLTRL